MKQKVCAVLLAIGFAGAGDVACAQDTLKIAVGQRSLWDTSVSELGQRGGIFKKHGLVLELLYTQGSGETQQAVIAGSVDIGVSVGIMGALSAYAKGAPVRIIGAEMTGAGDLFWYVKSEFTDQVAQGYRGKDDRLFDRRGIHPRCRHRVHQAVRSQGETGRDRQPAYHA